MNGEKGGVEAQSVSGAPGGTRKFDVSEMLVDKNEKEEQEFFFFNEKSLWGEKLVEVAGKKRARERERERKKI